MELGGTLEISLENKVAELERLRQALTDFGRRHGLSPGVVHDLDLALEEILTNIITFGYTDSSAHEIRVSLRVQPGEARIDVEDDGRPFNPLEAPEPDTTTPLEERAVGGLGILLVRQRMDDIEYTRHGGRNLLTIRKATHGDPNEP